MTKTMEVLLQSSNLVYFGIPSITILLVYIYCSYKLSYWKRRGVTQLKNTSKIFGDLKNAILFRTAPGYHLGQLYRDAPADVPFVGFYIFHKPCLLMKDPQIIKQILIRDFDKFSNRHFAGFQQKDSIGMINLFGLKNPAWRYLRKKISPTLTRGKLRQMLPLMMETGKPMVDHLNKLTETKKPKVIDAQDVNYKYTADLIANVALGTKTDCFSFPDSDYSKCLMDFFHSFKRMVALVTVFFTPELVKIVGPPMVVDLTCVRKIFWEAVESREKTGEKRGDNIDSIIQLKNGKQNSLYKFDGDNLFSQCGTFFSGFESSSAAAAFTLMELAKEKEVQDRVREDINQAIDKHGWTLEAFAKMKYLDQCISEGLRLHPAVSTVDRYTLEDYQIPNTDIVVEKGTPIFISLYGLHGDPKYFQEPEKFKPERFDGNSIIPDAYIPFGAGPRKCIGVQVGQLHVKVVLSMILSAYEVRQSKSADVKLDSRSTFTAAADGINLEFINHITRTASWLPPAENWPSSREGSSGSHAEEEDDLPYGWEQATDSHEKPYYINHVNKTTTYVAPEGCSCESPPAPRDVVLERDPELGFGFVAGSERPVLVRFVTDNSPSVGKLEPGDQILCVNGEDVSTAAREHVIAAVRACAEKVTLRVCQPARTGNPMRRSALLSAAKRARLRARPPRVRFADSVQLNGAPMYPPSAFSLGDLCLPPMANVLKVFLENGQTKSFKYDTTTTVADVVQSLKDKLCITADEHFSLVVEHVKSLRRNKLTLLDPKESLARIAARPGSHKMRCLFRVVFMPNSAAELAQRDLAALDYLYMQCCNDVAQERFAPELQPDVALRLAALHMHQHALANNLSPAKLTVKAVEREFGLERFIPIGLLESMKRKELRRLLAHCLKLNSQMTGSQRQLTQLQAKLHYLDIVAGLPSYGAKCFSSSRPERVLLVSPRFGLSQIVGRNNSVPQSIASLEEVEGIRVKGSGCGAGGGGGGGGGAGGAGGADVAVFLRRDRVLALLMDERDAHEMPLVVAGYYRLATGQELNVEQEREPITEDIAPPYLSQHNVVPAKWSYLHFDDPNILTKKHYAIFSMPPPYHSTPDQSKASLDTNMNSNMSNKNSSNNSSPLIGYDSKTGLLGHDIHFDKCKRNEEFRLFDPNDACYLDDGMGFDLQSVLSMELLENATNNPRLVEAKNEEVLRRVAEMQKLVENSEQYLTENCDVFNDPYNDGILRDELVGKETCVDNIESDTESNNSRMSAADDAPGILKHSDSLLLLTETINQGLSVLSVPENGTDNNSAPLTTRQSQGLSAILNNCGLTDALLALNSDLCHSESDNDSLYTPTSSPIRRHQNKPTNKVVRTSFGLHSPDAQDNKEPNLKEYLKQLKEKSSKEDAKAADVPFFYQESMVDNDAELIDLTLIPPPQTPDELDCATQVPQILPVVPPSFADDRESMHNSNSNAPKTNELEAFIATVTIQPPTVKVTPAIELTPEEILSYIIPPPPSSNSSTLDREQVSYANHTQILEAKNAQNTNSDDKPSNGEVVKGTLSVSEIRNMFTAKSLSEARNSLLLKDKTKSQVQGKSDSPKGKRKSVTEKQSNGTAHVIEYPTVERKGMFSCCSKDKSKNEESEGTDKVDGQLENSDSMPDVCEIRPPPRRKNSEVRKPPERPPKTPPTPAPRPRSNSFTCLNNELTAVEIPNNHFSTLNNRKLNYKVVCEINEQYADPPVLPPRIENKVLPPPPPLLLPPKKPPLPPVPSIEVLRLKNAQKQSPLRNSEQRLASIGSPHFQRNLNTYRNLENESRVTDDEALNVRSTQNYSSMTLQSRHVRSNSETKSTILKNKEMSTALSLCSPQMNRRFSNRPDLLNGAPTNEQKVFSPPLSERKAFRLESASPTPKVQNHVRFKEDVVDDIPTPPSPPTVKFPEFQGNNGHVSIEGLLCKTEVAVDGLLQRLHQAAQKCSHQHAHGGGEDIDEIKFQRARSELTACAVSLVGASRALVGALGEGGGAPGEGGGAAALADCLAPLRRLADLAQALGRHTSAPLQTRNLVLRVHDVTAAFKELAGAEMAQIIHEHNTKKAQGQSQETNSTLEGQLALRAECLANVLATLLRSLRVFSP